MAETVRRRAKEAALEMFERESDAAATPLSDHELDAAARLKTQGPMSVDGGGTASGGAVSPRYSVAAAGGAATRISQLADFVAESLRRLPEWRRFDNRWVVPVLALVVVIQSAWLIADRFRNDSSGTTNPATSTKDAVSDQSARATSGVRPSGVQQPDEIGAGQAARARPSVASNNSSAARRTPAGAVPPVVKPAAAPGSVLIAVPFQVEVYENGRFIGINGEKGVPLAAGSHRIELVNDSLRYRSSHTVDVTSDRTTRMTVALPTGMLHMNATPWAEVLVDGQSVGETPLANVEVPIGSHRITFRHPQWGEQTRSIVVAVASSTRIGVDLQK